MSLQKSEGRSTVAATTYVCATAIIGGLKVRAIKVTSGGIALVRSYMKVVGFIPKLEWGTHSPQPHIRTHTLQNKNSAARFTAVSIQGAIAYDSNAMIGYT